MMEKAIEQNEEVMPMVQKGEDKFFRDIKEHDIISEEGRANYVASSLKKRSNREYRTWIDLLTISGSKKLSRDVSSFFEKEAIYFSKLEEISRRYSKQNHPKETLCYESKLSDCDRESVKNLIEYLQNFCLRDRSDVDKWFKGLRVAIEQNKRPSKQFIRSIWHSREKEALTMIKTINTIRQFGIPYPELEKFYWKEVLKLIKEQKIAV